MAHMDRNSSGAELPKEEPPEVAKLIVEAHIATIHPKGSM